MEKYLKKLPENQFPLLAKLSKRSIECECYLKSHDLFFPISIIRAIFKSLERGKWVRLEGIPGDGKVTYLKSICNWLEMNFGQKWLYCEDVAEIIKGYCANQCVLLDLSLSRMNIYLKKLLLKLNSFFNTRFPQSNFLVIILCNESR